MTAETNNGIDGYTQSSVGDYTILTPKDKKASVYQKVTPREQYAVARDVANRAINEINAIRADSPSSFTGGINDANIAARMQAAETYGDTLPGRRASTSFRPMVGIGSDVPVRGIPAPESLSPPGPPPPWMTRREPPRELINAERLSATAPQISEIRGDWGYGPSIRYPEPGQQVGPTDPDVGPTDPDVGPTDPDVGPIDPVEEEVVVVDENPWWEDRNDYNRMLQTDQGWSGTYWDSQSRGDIYDTGSFARTNYFTNQLKTAAGDDNNLSYDEYIQAMRNRPDSNAYHGDTKSNALANYWATSGATIDQQALDENNLFLQGDNLLQKLWTGDGGPNLALNDYVSFDSRVDDGDDDYFTYYNWGRK